MLLKFYVILAVLQKKIHTVSQSRVYFSLTFVEVFWALAGVAAAVGATLLLRRTLLVTVAALHAGRREAAGSLWRWAAALLR